MELSNSLTVAIKFLTHAMAEAEANDDLEIEDPMDWMRECCAAFTHLTPVEIN
jgi:hypothetical protein